MKWVGQQIYDFISRFRNDVYLENISTGTIASGGNLGLDANNKIVKADTEAGELTITNASSQRVVTSTGGTGLNAEATFTYNSTINLLDISANDAGNLPFFRLSNTNTGAAGPAIEFVKSADGDDDDTLGSITFKGDDDGGNEQIYGRIQSEISDATAGQEAGRLSFKVAEFDGTLTEGLKIEGDTNADGEIDVIIGAGAASTTTIAGTLTMGSTAFANNSGVIQVATQGTIDHDSLANFVAAEHVDWASASAGTIHSTNIPTLNQNTTGQAGTVATITGLAPDTATTQATQPNITTLAGFVTGSANQLLTDDGDGTVTSESALTFSNNKLTIAGTGLGQISLGGTFGSGHPSSITNAVGTNILLNGTSVFTTAVPSMIKFNAAPSATDQAAAYIEGAHANGTDKQGGDVIIVAGASTGNNASGSFKFWGDAGGGGSDSNINAPTEKFSISGDGNTTIAGSLTMGTTAAMTNAGLLSVAAQTNITSLGTLTNLQVDSVNINNKAIEIQGDTGDTFNITTGAAGATTLTTTDAAAAAGHFEIAADGDITLDAEGDIVLETNGGQLTCDAAGYTFSSGGGERPAFTIRNAANDATGPNFIISNVRDGNGLNDGDSLGTINFTGADVAGQSEGYATIQGVANETADGDECGTLNFYVANNGALKEGIVISADSGTTSEVDVQIGNGVVSTTTIAGMLESTGRVTIKNGDYLYFNDDDNSHATRVIGSTTSTNRTITLPDATGTVALNNISYHHITASFFDTLGTTAHYIPLGDSTAEVTSDLNTLTDWIAPCETTVDSIIMRMTNITATANITFTVQKDAVGSFSTTDVEAETLNVGSTNEHDVLFFKFDSATIAKGETLKIKIQCASNMTSSTNHFVRVNLIMNWDDRYTGSSQIFTS